MDRRHFMATTAALAGVSFGPRALAQTDADAALRALLDQFFNDQVDENPERATSLGLDKGARAGLKARLNDRSRAETKRDLERSRKRLAALHGIGRAKLTGMSLIDYDVIDYQLSKRVTNGDRWKFGSVGRNFAPYVVTQQDGAYQDIPNFLDTHHPVANVADADAYISRLKAFPDALDQNLDEMLEDRGAGVIPPNFIIKTTIGQLKALRDVAPEATVLAQSIARKAAKAGLSPDYGAKATQIVKDEVFPALDRQINALEGLLAMTDDRAGVWKLKDGDEYYAAALQIATTTTLTPAQVHQLGLDQAAEISGRIDALLKAQSMAQGTVSQRLAALNDDPRQLYANTDDGRAALIEQLNGQIAVMYGKLPTVFAVVPKAKLEIRRVPPFIQDGAANGYYESGALDGSRPAIYYINLKDTHDWPKFGLGTLTYHEGVPGHHLQISTAQETPAIPLIRRAGGGFSAYVEGWALYAEQLASEIGSYEGDAFGQIGFLQSFLFRAARLVVDTGIHFKRWTRDQAIDYMMATTGYARGRVTREIDRYCVSPGQACSYKVGHTVFARTREAARARLGARFDLKAFHTAAIGSGAMPLTVLEAHIARTLV